MKLKREIGDSPRFLITRLSAIGDCVHTVPIVAALRRAYPKCWIAWATQGGPAKLLSGLPGLDEIITVDRDWLKSPRQMMRMRKRLRESRFDVALDPQSLTKSAMLGWLSGARVRVGFAAPQGRELGPVLNNETVVPEHEHVVERYLELVAAITDGRLPDVEFCLPKHSLKSVDKLLGRNEFAHGYAVVNPGAGWPSKLWVPSRFAEVARHLGTAHRLPTLVVWAGDEERGWANTIAAESGGYATVAPTTSLVELQEVLRSASLCVAADTGPLHLAAAVDTPCVGLYGTTRPERCGPYGVSHRTLQAYYQEGSSRERRTAANDAMRNIGADDVIEACDTLLSDRSSAKLDRTNVDVGQVRGQETTRQPDPSPHRAA